MTLKNDKGRKPNRKKPVKKKIPVRNRQNNGKPTATVFEWPTYP